MEIYEKLRKLREKRNLTYQELFEELGEQISISTLKAYESKSVYNRRHLTTRAVDILSNFYDVSREYLLYEDVTNEKREDININEILGLSDKTIEIIKRINEKEVVTGGTRNLLFKNEKNIETFNSFIEKFDNWYDFLILLEDYKYYLNYETCLNNILILTSSNSYLLYYYFNDKGKFNSAINLLESNFSLFNDLQENSLNNQQFNNETLTNFTTNFTSFINTFKHKTISKMKKKELFMNITEIQASLIGMKQTIKEKAGFTAYRITTLFNEFINNEFIIENNDNIKKISEEELKLESNFSKEDVLKYTFTEEAISESYKKSKNEK